MTQTQIVQALAEKCEVSKKVSHGFLTALSETAIREVKKNGVFVLPEEGEGLRIAASLRRPQIHTFRVAGGRDKMPRQ